MRNQSKTVDKMKLWGETVRSHNETPNYTEQSNEEAEKLKYNVY